MLRLLISGRKLFSYFVPQITPTTLPVPASFTDKIQQLHRCEEATLLKKQALPVRQCWINPGQISDFHQPH